MADHPESGPDRDARRRSAAARARTNKRILFPPQELVAGFEVAVVACPRALQSDLEGIFPGVDLTRVVTLMSAQRCANDITNVGPAIADEKDRLLESFVGWAAAVCDALAERDPACWSDYIDPCSGLAVRTEGAHVVYNEVDAFSSMLRYHLQSAGMCRVVSHPRWGTSVYPCSMFTTAPFAIVEEVLAAGVGLPTPRPR